MTAPWTPISAPLEHLVGPPTTVSDAYATLVLLHGRGADAQDLMPLVAELGRDDLLILAPQAPYALPGPFGIGYAWYDMHEIGEPDPASFAPSLGLLRQFLEAAIAGYPVATDRLFLLGFSQGAVMALAVGLAEPKRLAGVIALSGYLPVAVDAAASADIGRLSVFIGHGNADPLIPVDEGRHARDALTAAGADVTYGEYPTAHRIAPAELEDIRTWIDTRLDATPPG